MKGKILFFLNILLIILALANITFSNSYLKDGYEFNGNVIVSDDKNYNMYEIKNKDAKNISRTGNPLDLVVAYKEEMDGIIDGSYQDVGNYDDTVDEGEIDFNSILYKLSENSLDMKNNLKKSIIPQSYNLNIKEINDTKNIKLLVVLSFLLMASIVILVLTKKKIVIVASAAIVLIGIYHLIPTKQLIDKHNHIEEYVLTNEVDNHLSNQIVDDDLNKEKIINNLNQKWSIANLINDYIIKVVYCKQKKDKNESITKDDIYSYTGEYNRLNFYSSYNSENEDAFNYNNVPLIKYMDKDNFDKSDILYKRIDYDEMVLIYDNIDKINDNKNDFYSKLIDEISGKINHNDIDDEELLFHYLARITDLTYIEPKQDYLDNNLISYFKDWYLESDKDIGIELPYGIILHYEAPKFIKKNIKEIVYTNEDELNRDSKEKQVYVMYYKDSNGNLNGTYTDVEFISNGNDYKIDFNPYELLYDIRKPIIKLVANNMRHQE